MHPSIAKQPISVTQAAGQKPRILAGPVCLALTETGTRLKGILALAEGQAALLEAQRQHKPS